MEFLFTDGVASISQREIGTDTINRLAQYAVVAACVISGLHYVQHAYRELSQARAEGA